MKRRALAVALVCAALPARTPARAEEGPPPEPAVKVTTFALPHPDVSEETMVAIVRAVENGLKKNPRLELRDLESRLADFAQEVPQEQVESAKVALKEGQKALLELNIPLAIEKLQDAVAGLSKVLPYIKKQELADAMAWLGVAYYEGGDKKSGRDAFTRLLTWRPDYVFDPQRLNPKYIALFEEAQHEVERARRGSISIGTDPPGVQAYVDGKYVGITPCDAEGLPVGEHFVTFKKEGYKKAVATAMVSSRHEQRVQVALERSEKYLLVEQSLAKVQASLGGDRGDPEMDNLRQVLFIDHGVFVRAVDKGSGKVEATVLLYDLRTRRRLSGITRIVYRSQAESELASVAQALYLNVNYLAELALPKDAPPPTQQRRAPIYKTWWFWTAAGVVLAGAVGAIVAVVETRQPGCPDGSTCLHITQ